jgi:GT2 family glycosyltransferase
MDLSIIIVSWKVKNILRENLETIYKNTGNIDFEIFVVDNNSGDGTVEMVKNIFPKVDLIANSENLGFAKANNQAIDKAKGRYVLLLNPDMRILPGALEKMISWMDSHPQAGIAGCRLVNEKNETIKHVRKFPTLIDQLAIILKLPHLFPKILDKYIISDFDYFREAEVDSIRGSFFMIRRKLIEKIGGLDERYFIWFEEVDYCKQAILAGWKVFFTPAADCVDLVGQSFFKVKRGVKQNYFRDSMLEYFKKWHPVWQHYILKIAWIIVRPAAIFLDFFKIKSLK